MVAVQRKVKFYLDHVTEAKQVCRELIVSNYLVGEQNNPAVKAKIEKYEKKLT